MEEKIMVNDILQGVKNEIYKYQEMILECENMQLRQTIQQIRDNYESFEYELYRVAELKDYYKPSKQASYQEIEDVKKELK